jgi:hypothetical protein
MPVINNPWPHLCFDDYLSPDDFDKHSQAAQALGTPVGDYSNIKRHYLDYDPVPQMGELINFFTEKRGYWNLAKQIHYAVTPAGLDHPIHVDNDAKIMSAVLYLYPNDHEVDWTPNKLFVFCGKDDVTHHSYYSTTTRYTLNYFLVDPGKLEDPILRSRCIT